MSGPRRRFTDAVDAALSRLLRYDLSRTGVVKWVYFARRLLAVMLITIVSVVGLSGYLSTRQAAALLKDSLRREEFDLGLLARAAADGLRRTAPERDAEFAIQEGLRVVGDPGLLRAAVENLLGNAWKYTSRHPRAHRVRRAARGWPDGLLRARRRGGLRHGARRQAVPAVQPPALPRGVRRDRDRAGHGPARRRAARRPDLGRRRGGEGRRVLFHAGRSAWT